MICPQCRKVTVGREGKFFPFCSARCKNLDLGDWASEKYRIPAEEPPDGENETAEEESEP